MATPDRGLLIGPSSRCLAAVVCCCVRSLTTARVRVIQAVTQKVVDAVHKVPPPLPTHTRPPVGLPPVRLACCAVAALLRELPHESCGALTIQLNRGPDHPILRACCAPGDPLYPGQDGDPVRRARPGPHSPPCRSPRLLAPRDIISDAAAIWAARHFRVHGRAHDRAHPAAVSLPHTRTAPTHTHTHTPHGSHHHCRHRPAAQRCGGGRGDDEVIGAIAIDSSL